MLVIDEMDCLGVAGSKLIELRSIDGIFVVNLPMDLPFRHSTSEDAE